MGRGAARPAPVTVTPLQARAATVVHAAGSIHFDLFCRRMGVRDLTGFRVATALLDADLVHLGPTRDLVWGPAPAVDR